MKQNLYTIQEVSSILGVSPKTLRRWEDNGLIKPIRTAGNQRRYLLEDVKTLERRKKLKEARNEVRSNIVQQVPVKVPDVDQAAPTSINSNIQYQIPTPVLPPIVNFPASRNNNANRFIKPVFSGVITILILFVGAVFWQHSGNSVLSLGMKAPQNTNMKEAVLGTNDAAPLFQLNVNLPTFFSAPVAFLDSVSIQKGLSVTGESQLNGGVTTNNADITAGSGKVTASNLLYSIVAGSNISITGNKQNPTISATVTGGVSSVDGTQGAVSLAQGSGISLNGLTISNSGVLSVGGTSGAVTLGAGGGISVSGTTITNTDLGSSQDIFKNFTIGGIR